MAATESPTKLAVEEPLAASPSPSPPAPPPETAVFAHSPVVWQYGFSLVHSFGVSPRQILTVAFASSNLSPTANRASLCTQMLERVHALSAVSPQLSAESLPVGLQT